MCFVIYGEKVSQYRFTFLYCLSPIHRLNNNCYFSHVFRIKMTFKLTICVSKGSFYITFKDQSDPKTELEYICLVFQIVMLAVKFEKYN